MGGLSKDIVAERFIVTGRVQGVGFRYQVARYANTLRLHGWTLNNADGSVTIVCQGPRDSVDQMYRWCADGKSSPPSRIDNVTRQPEAIGEFTRFSIQ